jgi:hypothetical protein
MPHTAASARRAARWRRARRAWGWGCRRDAGGGGVGPRGMLGTATPASTGRRLPGRCREGRGLAACPLRCGSLRGARLQTQRPQSVGAAASGAPGQRRAVRWSGRVGRAACLRRAMMRSGQPSSAAADRTIAIGLLEVLQGVLEMVGIDPVCAWRGAHCVQKAARAGRELLRGCCPWHPNQGPSGPGNCLKGIVVRTASGWACRHQVMAISAREVGRRHEAPLAAPAPPPRPPRARAACRAGGVPTPQTEGETPPTSAGHALPLNFQGWVPR